MYVNTSEECFTKNDQWTISLVPRSHKLRRTVPDMILVIKVFRAYTVLRSSEEDTQKKSVSLIPQLGREIRLVYSLWLWCSYRLEVSECNYTILVWIVSKRTSLF